MATEAHSRDSIVSILLWSTQGRMLLFMGGLYTVIVSMSLALLYFTAGLTMTGGVTAVYLALTTGVVYFRAPARKLVPPAIILFDIVPIVTAAGIILTGTFLL